MKTNYFLLLPLFLLLIGCGESATDNALQEYIPGTYTRQSVGEFGKSWDTIIISLQNKEAKQYKITRRWKYDRVLDGKPIEPEYKVTETSGTYNPETKALQETETLDFFTFDPVKKLLFEGSNQFNKIK